MNPLMTLRRSSTVFLILLSLGFLLSNLRGPVADAQGQIQVNAADPPSAQQGTFNLSVKVTGKGFKNGAKAKWFVTGTTDPGGVTVNSTAFVSSTEVTANITVADTAVIANFDIQVLNSDGRGGKGTELFAVTAKGQTICPALQPVPTSDTKCYAAWPGCLDMSFGGVGYVHTDAAPNYVSGGDQADGVAVQPDGKVVVAGRTRISSTDIDFTVIRYNIDGSLDTSFGDVDPLNAPLRRGYTLTSITNGFDYPHGMLLQPDGKIIVSGAISGGGSVVVRYNPDGTLDLSFGSGGIVVLNFGKRVESPKGPVALQSDGKILISGGSSGSFAVARLLPNGSQDSSFGSGGLALANPSSRRNGYGWGLGLAVQRVPATTGEERIVVVGLTDNWDWTVIRFRSNGVLDTSFGNSGVVTTAFSGFRAEPKRIRVDSNNRLVVAGYTYTASTDCGSYVTDFAVTRYTPDGNLDGAFGGGRQTVDIYGGTNLVYGLAIQADDKIVLVGSAKSGDNSVTHIGLVRLNVDGTRDASFGLLGNGVVTTDLYGTQSYGLTLALQPTDGKIVVAGGAYLGPGNTQGEIVVARYWP